MGKSCWSWRWPCRLSRPKPPRVFYDRHLLYLTVFQATAVSAMYKMLMGSQNTFWRPFHLFFPRIWKPDSGVGRWWGLSETLVGSICMNEGVCAIDNEAQWLYHPHSNRYQIAWNYGFWISLGSIYSLELEAFVPLLIFTPTPVPLLSPRNSPRPGRPSTLGDIFDSWSVIWQLRHVVSYLKKFYTYRSIVLRVKAKKSEDKKKRKRARRALCTLEVSNRKSRGQERQVSI